MLCVGQNMWDPFSLLKKPIHQNSCAQEKDPVSRNFRCNPWTHQPIKVSPIYKLTTKTNKCHKIKPTLAMKSTTSHNTSILETNHKGRIDCTWILLHYLEGWIHPRVSYWGNLTKTNPCTNFSHNNNYTLIATFINKVPEHWEWLLIFKFVVEM